MMAKETPKLPKGAAEWVAPTDAEIEAAATITPEDIADAAAWADSLGGELGGLLNAKPMKTDG